MTNEETLLQPEPGSTVALTPTDASGDGRYLIFSRSQGVAGSTDIWALPLSGERKPFAVIQTPGTDSAGMLSPNGKWIAYSSSEGARVQVFVQPFPPTGGKFQISRDGGYMPLWSASGQELFFISQDGRMMTSRLETNGPFQSAAPAPLFTIATLVPQGAVGRQYAVTKDGRFLVNVLEQQTSRTPLTVVVNWLAAAQR